MQTNSRKVILHVITALKTGGAENMLALLLETNNSEKFEHIVVSIRPEGEIRHRIEKTGTKIFDLDVTGSFTSFVGVIKLSKLIRKLKPDIIQGWMYHGDLFSVLSLQLSKRRKKTKLYWGVRCSNLDLNNYSLQLRIVIWLCVKLSRFPDLIIVNSESGINFHKSLGYHANNFKLIDNGVDINKFKFDENMRITIRNELKISIDTVVAIVAARNDPMKDYQTLLSVLLKIDNCTVIVAGSGTEILPHQANVLRLGRRGDMQNLFSAADFLISSSAFGEGFSNSISEGMSCSLPVVATDVGDSKRIVGNAGYIVSPKNRVELKEGIMTMLKLASTERKNMGESARKRISEKYTIQRTISKFKNIYTI